MLVSYNKYFNLYYDFNSENDFYRVISKKIVNRKIKSTIKNSKNNKYVKIWRLTLKQCYIVENNGSIYDIKMKTTPKTRILYETIKQ